MWSCGTSSTLGERWRPRPCLWAWLYLASLLTGRWNSKKKNTSRPWTYSTICDGEAFTFQWVKITHNLFSLIQFANDLPYAQLTLAAGQNSKENKKLALFLTFFPFLHSETIINYPYPPAPSHLSSFSRWSFLVGWWLSNPPSVHHWLPQSCPRIDSLRVNQ